MISPNKCKLKSQLTHPEVIPCVYYYWYMKIHEIQIHEKTPHIWSIQSCPHILLVFITSQTWLVQQQQRVWLLGVITVSQKQLFKLFQVQSKGLYAKGTETLNDTPEATQKTCGRRLVCGAFTVFTRDFLPIISKHLETDLVLTTNTK